MILTDEMFNRAWMSMNESELAMDELVVKQREKVFKHVFTDKETKTNIRSISKLITCLCYGIAIDKGYFKNGLDEIVYPYLVATQTITNQANIQRIEKWTIKTLLTLTIGYEKKMLDSKHLPSIQGENYGDVVLNTELNHEPGEFFIYSNAAMYLASIVFQNATGIKLADFANEYLFSPLGIEHIYWQDSPQGFSMGCTGIEMHAEELIKIGEILIGKGKYCDKPIVSSWWIEQMMKPQVLTPMMYDEKRILPKYAYGLNLWICKDGIVFCDGTDGQYIIIIPQNDIIIVTIAHQHNMKPITECLNHIIHPEE